MVWMQPPPKPTPPTRRAPRREYTHELDPLVLQYAKGDFEAGRVLRRVMAPPLADLAEAALGHRQGRQRISQNAITMTFAALERVEIPARGVTAAFHAMAQVLRATGHSLLEWIDALDDWERAVLRILDVELADPARLARAFHLPVELVRAGRESVAEVIGLAQPRESNCPGWPDVRRALRHDDAGATAHRNTCGRCTLVAEQTLLRRARLWQGSEPVGGLASAFDPRRY